MQYAQALFEHIKILRLADVTNGTEVHIADRLVTIDKALELFLKDPKLVKNELPIAKLFF